MNILIPLAVTGLFAAGATAGIIGVVTVAIRREEKNLTLTSAATDHVTRAGRLLTGVGVRAPRGAAADRETTSAQPADERAQGPGTNSPGTGWPYWILAFPGSRRRGPPRRKRRRGITLVWSEGFHQSGSR